MIVLLPITYSAKDKLYIKLIDYKVAQNKEAVENVSAALNVIFLSHSFLFFFSSSLTW
jgi:hypothetical protein